jgi:hypothetical protein
MQTAIPLDGHCNGPLFAPVAKRRPARVRKSGGAEVWAKYRRARPLWARTTRISAFWKVWSPLMTQITGVQHSVDYIVPLKHPLVCGLHVEHNLRVVPLVENILKGNNTWPDMWGEQPELFA